MAGMAALLILVVAANDAGWRPHVEQEREVRAKTPERESNRQRRQSAIGDDGANQDERFGENATELVGRERFPDETAVFEDTDEDLDGVQNLKGSLIDTNVWENSGHLFEADEATTLPRRGGARQWLENSPESDEPGKILRHRLQRGGERDRFEDPIPMMPDVNRGRRANRNMRDSNEIVASDPLDEPSERVSRTTEDVDRYPRFNVPNDSLIPGIADDFDNPRNVRDRVEDRPEYSARTNDNRVIPTRIEPTREQARQSLLEIVGLSTDDRNRTSDPTVKSQEQLFDFSGDRTWLILLALFGLFASLGFNLYLGWIAWDIHGRYQDVVADLNELESRENDVVSKRTHPDHKRERESDRLAAHA